MDINTLTPRQALGQVTDEVRNYLRFLSDMGAGGLACSEKSLETIAGWGVVKGRAAALKAGALRKKGLDLPGAVPDAGRAVSPVQQAVSAPGGATVEVRPAGSGPQEGAAGSWTDTRNMDSAVPRAAAEKRNEVSDSWSRASRTERVAPEGSDSLERIRADLAQCGRCGISRSKKNLVFGEGNPRARLMFIGEAPGPEEESLGRPFAGAQGELLTRMIGAMGLSREDVYLCNLAKCRPLGDGHPSPEEILNCRPFLERQIRAVEPEVICTLGAVATMAILGVTRGVAQLRGRFQAYGTVKVMPTFHPGFLLQNPGCKKAAWEDLQKVMAVLGLKRK